MRGVQNQVPFIIKLLLLFHLSIKPWAPESDNGFLCSANTQSLTYYPLLHTQRYTYCPPIPPPPPAPHPDLPRAPESLKTRPTKPRVRVARVRRSLTGARTASYRSAALSPLLIPPIGWLFVCAPCDSSSLVARGIERGQASTLHPA